MATTETMQEHSFVDQDPIDPKNAQDKTKSRRPPSMIHPSPHACRPFQPVGLRPSAFFPLEVRHN